MIISPLLAALALIHHLEQTVSIEPGQIEEPCFSMQIAERLEFSFRGSAELDFNIHYLEDQSVSFPVDLKAVREEEGVFIAPAAHQYCLMWTNQSEEVIRLDYRYRLYAIESRP